MIRWLLWLLTLPFRLPVWTLRFCWWRWRRPNTLHLVISGTLSDTGPSHALERIGGDEATSLLDAILVLEQAEDDPNIEHVWVELRSPRTGLGRCEELRSALSRISASGKHVTTHSHEFDLGAYWIALGGAEIAMSPQGTLNAAGFAIEFSLLKGLLDKLGIVPQLRARGEYKNLHEMWTSERMSEANREMLQSLVDEYHRLLVQRVAQARHIAEAEVRRIIDAAPLRGPDALSHRLIDELAYWDDLRQRWQAQGKHRVISAQRYLAHHRRGFLPRRRRRVALLSVTGHIKTGKDATGARGRRATGADSFLATVKRLREDRRTEAVILRVDSPGGSALASDLMWHSLTGLAQRKPLFISMANVAASGGYYVSGVQGAVVWANPTTLTGSIGVVAGKFLVAPGLEQLGIRREAVQAGRYANYHSPTRPFTSDELLKLEAELDATYRDFVQKMAQARTMDESELEPLARGRVWTGSQAHAKHLVDELGGLREVYEALRARLGLHPREQLRIDAASRPHIAQLLRSRIAPPLALTDDWFDQWSCQEDLAGERCLAWTPLRLRW